MVKVVKSSGESQEFDPGKVVDALVRTGAPQEVAARIAKEVEAQAYDGMPTRRVFAIAYDLLEGENAPLAAKFNLKRALMGLGPEGFVFERYFARILDWMGYATEGGRVFKGACADQEVDVVAAKGAERRMVECKYHNLPGIVTGLKEAMYTWARLEDVNAGGEKFTGAWIVTNTKVSDEAVRYAGCKGMLTTSWGFPKGQSLQELIGESKLYPLTVLTLGDQARERLLKAGVVTVQDLLAAGPKGFASMTGGTKEEFERLAKEAEGLLKL